ncbi:conserved hypothetical protein [Neorickettsia risticii str. Illinois]|uniref:Uncharacterized protein n=1 Tax=Neorickettsia risticii (strain Illinois) TaxID=434131 RepID=C6V4J2_NEORI|nr:conserved hypothetical protein [Neorickettsia risticii str. Illinois]
MSKLSSCLTDMELVEVCFCLHSFVVLRESLGLFCGFAKYEYVG